MKIYIPKTEKVREKIKNVLAEQISNKKDYICSIDEYTFLKELSKEEFDKLDFSSDERETGNIIILDDGESYVLDGKELLSIGKFPILKNTDFSVKENNDEDIHIRVMFPNRIINYLTKTTPTLNDILNNEFVQEKYNEMFAEKEDGILEVEVKSETEGNLYYYDVVSKTWYFNKKVPNLKEDRERLEQFKQKYIQEEKEFKKRQRKKLYMLLITIALMGIVTLLDVNSPNSKLALIYGCICIVLISIDWALSMIRGV